MITDIHIESQLFAVYFTNHVKKKCPALKSLQCKAERNNILEKSSLTFYITRKAGWGVLTLFGIIACKMMKLFSLYFHASPVPMFSDPKSYPKNLQCLITLSHWMIPQHIAESYGHLSNLHSFHVILIPWYHPRKLYLCNEQ